jgi:hypothetical protein
VGGLPVNFCQHLLENIGRIIFSPAIGYNIILHPTSEQLIDFPDNGPLVMQQRVNITLIRMGDGADKKCFNVNNSDALLKIGQKKV